MKVQQLETSMFIIAGLACFLLFATVVAGKEPVSDNTAFNDYWYAGQAEITRYELTQARYGELRKGDAVLIFVTEDFLSDKQVKYEFGGREDAVSVLKLNFTRKFYTGIYPYSIMTSVFTPVDFNELPTLKVTSSSQEWCGHTFTQFNNRGKKLAVELRSYFQAEGDQDFEMPQALLEDEIWTRIRISPESLPTGKIEIIPATQYARLRHKEIKVEHASANLAPAKNTKPSDPPRMVYSVKYEELQRTLSITFNKNFPYEIVGWEELYPSGFGPDAKILTTTAAKTHSMRLAYWSRNKLSDSHLRDDLGIIY